MNNKKNIRRKWSFEKGRNSSSILLASLSLAAILVPAVFLFDYEYSFQEREEQHSEMSMIDPELNTEFFQMVERRDPLHTYGIYGGSFSSLLGEKQYNVDIQRQNIPVIPEYSSVVTSVPPETTPFPASVRYAAIPEKLDKIPLIPRVVTPEGKAVALDTLAKVKGSPVRDTMIRLSGRAPLLRSEILRSCGDGKLDKMAVNALKHGKFAPGIYLVNWAGTGGRP